MNKIYRIAILFLIFFGKISTQAQDMGDPYYVVAGGFSSEENAARFTTLVHELNYPARYDYNADRNLYYVYLRVTEDKQVARELVYRLRSEPEFKNAWVYQGSLHSPSGKTTTEKKEKLVTDALDTRQEGSSVVEDHAIIPDPDPPEPVQSFVEEPVSTKVAAKPGQRAFVFQLLNSDTDKPIHGQVHLMESERDPSYQQYEGNETVYISAPRNKNGRWLIVCNLVGYKFFKKAITFNSAVNQNKGADQVVIPIRLTSVKRGDYIELEHVKFFEHSAIMKPESEGELLELVNLMENPDYKIRLHGHIHTDASGEIVTLGESRNFFVPDPANKQIHGSAKTLTRYRAETVKAYLVSKGIDESRIFTKGQGALLAIYEQASANERIEVEVLRH